MNVPEQALVLDRPGPKSLRIGLGTFFGPDSVHAQHLFMICSIGCSINASYWSPATADNCLEVATDHSLYAEKMTDDRAEAGEGV